VGQRKKAALDIATHPLVRDYKTEHTSVMGSQMVQIIDTGRASYLQAGQVTFPVTC
jgi:hypothetical protein